MKYKFKNKELDIPDEELENLVDTLEVSLQEAIEIWLDDNDYTENEAAAALTKKAKDNRIMATIHQAKSDAAREKRKVERKEDPLKEGIVNRLEQFLLSQGDLSNVRITNVGKIIEFESGGEFFKLDLVKRRKKK